LSSSPMSITSIRGLDLKTLCERTKQQTEHTTTAPFLCRGTCKTTPRMIKRQRFHESVTIHSQKARHAGQPLFLMQNAPTSISSKMLGWKLPFWETDPAWRILISISFGARCMCICVDCDWSTVDLPLVSEPHLMRIDLPMMYSRIYVYPLSKLFYPFVLFDVKDDNLLVDWRRSKKNSLFSGMKVTVFVVSFNID
jgi:hypothetical protein